jgi:hypothetical protein
MKFMITYTMSPATRDAGQARFLETGGLPGDGVEMLGRWHSLGGHVGYVLAESSDTVALGKWMQDWTDLLTFEITAVGDDEEIAAIMGV